MLPPERLRVGRVEVGRLDVEGFDELVAVPADRRGRAGSRSASKAGAALSIRSRFSATLKPGTTPSRIRSSGTKPSPALRISARVAAGELGAVEPDRAAGRRPEAGDRLGELALPVSRDAGDRDDLAGADLEAEPAHRLGAAVAHHVQVADRRGAPRPPAVAGGSSSDGSACPTIISASSCGVTSCGRTVPIFRPARSTVIRSESSSTSRILCEMKTRPRPSVDHLAEDDEEVVDLLRREHRGRLVEDQQRDVPVERLDDLHPLALADRELPDHGVGVDLEPVALGQLADPRRDGDRGR